MKLLISISLFFLSVTSLGQTNSIKRAFVEDAFREFVRIDFYGSIGTTAPTPSEFDVNEVNPAEVIMLSDTTCYLRFASSFTTGSILELDYTPLGGLLGGQPSQTNRVVDNGITSATVLHWTSADFANYFLGYDDNFNSVEGVADNTIIKLAAGNYGTIDIAQISNITFAAEYTTDSLLFTYVNFREKAIHVSLLGHPAAGRNIKIRSSYGYFGMGVFATGRLRFENLEIHHVVQGIQVKTVSDILTPPYNYSRLNYQALVTKNIWVHHTTQEAFYIGSDVAAPLIPISWTAWDLKVEHAGRDAYQYRNGNWIWLVNSTMTDIGEGLDDDHSHGVLYGTTTMGGYIANITGTNVRGYGMLINGYGTLTIKNCNISSGFNSPYIKNYDGHDEYGMGGLVVNIYCDNVFNCTGATDPRTPDIRMDPVKTGITVNISDQTIFMDPEYIEDGSSGTDNGVVINRGPFCIIRYEKRIPAGSRIKRYIH